MCMTTFAPNDPALEERTRQAWSTYRDGLSELSGREYDDAEAEAWTQLQDELEHIEADRAAGQSDGEAGG
jgi:hypothetical protein